MALTANTKRVYEHNIDPLLNDVVVKGSTRIFEGAAVGDDGSGFARGLVAGDVFRGFAVAEADNREGADGDMYVRVRERGRVVLAVVGAEDEDDVGETVYASADGTFTLTEGANSPVGKIARHESGTRCVVDFEAQQHRSL